MMDTFKGQVNKILRELCPENNCEVVIVPHNLTKKFRPLDINVNKAEKLCFLQNRYNDWFSNQVPMQLKSGNDPTDINIISKLSDLKHLYASWLADFYNHLFDNQDMRSITLGLAKQ